MISNQSLKNMEKPEDWSVRKTSNHDNHSNMGERGDQLYTAEKEQSNDEKIGLNHPEFHQIYIRNQNLMNMDLYNERKARHSESSLVLNGGNFGIQKSSMEGNTGQEKGINLLSRTDSDSRCLAARNLYEAEYKSYSIASEFLNDRKRINSAKPDLQNAAAGLREEYLRKDDKIRSLSDVNLHCDEKLTDSGDCQQSDDDDNDDDDYYDDASIKDSGTGDLQKGGAEENGREVQKLGDDEADGCIQDEQVIFSLNCTFCSFQGASKQDLADHSLLTHQVHLCTMCDFMASVVTSLHEHILQTHEQGVPPAESPADYVPVRDAGRRKNFHCKICDYRTTDRDQYWAHKGIHIPADRILRCPHVPCQFVTDLKHHMEYHLSSHSGEKPFKCDKCGYSCVNKSMLNSHMKSHSNYYPYRCQDCSFASKYPHPMKLHEEKRGHRRTRLIPVGELLGGLHEDTKPGIMTGDPALNPPNLGNLLDALDGDKQRRKRNRMEDVGAPNQDLRYPADGVFRGPNILPTLPNTASLPFMGFPGALGGMWPAGFLPRPPNNFPCVVPPYFGMGLQPNIAAFNAINAMQLARWFGPRLPEICGPISSNIRPPFPMICSPFKMARGTGDIEGVGNVFPASSPHKFNSTPPFPLMNNLNCTMCNFVTNFPIKLLEHTMTAHAGEMGNDSKLLRRGGPKLENFLPDGLQHPLLQSTPHKLSSVTKSSPRDLSRRKQGSKKYVGEKVRTEDKEKGINCVRESARILELDSTASGSEETNNGSKALHNQSNPDLIIRSKSSDDDKVLHNDDDDEDDYQPATENLLKISGEKIRTSKSSRSTAADTLDLISFRLQNKQITQNSKISPICSDASSSKDTSNGSDPLSPFEYSKINGNSSGKSEESVPGRTTQVGTPNEDEPQDLSSGRNTMFKELTPTSPTVAAINQGVARRLESTFTSQSSHLGYKMKSISSSGSEERSPPFGSTSSYDSSEISGESESLSKYRHKCVYCGLTFKDFSMYSIHMTYHGAVDPFTCNLCGEETGDKINFFIHMAKAAHEERK